MESMKQVVYFAAFLLCTFALADVYCITVTTSVGDIIGFEDKWAGRKLHKFRGIPYAEAPIGDLRFRAPVLKAPFPEPFEADRFGPACLYKGDEDLLFSEEQQNKDRSEDCLTLNIYVPDGGEGKKAVMVWIHGGGLAVGSGMHYDGSKMTAFGDVIVVTINYRLGLLGFFTTGDESAPGNYGLLDQQLAVKWVNRNIGAFGGDKNRVTLFGQSAGAVSVTWQMLAPGNQGLFHRVIAESGTPYTTAVVFPDPEVTKHYTNRLVENLGCTNSNTRQVVSCLRRLPADVFSAGLFAFPYYHTFAERIPVGLRIDGDFLPYSPESRKPISWLQDQPFFRSLDLLAGANKYDGAPLLSTLLRPFFEATMNQSLYDGVTKDVFRSSVNFWASKGDDSASALWWLYGTSINGNTKDLMRPQELLEFMGDALYFVRTVKFLKRHAIKTSETSGSTFMYSFLPSPSEGLGGIGKLRQPSPWVDGAKHTDDLVVLFGRGTVKENEGTMKDGEADLSNAMITYWTNFAKTGNPNKPAPVPHQWPGFQVGEEEFIEFDIKKGQLNLRTNAFYRNKYVSFWNEVLPLIERPRADDVGEPTVSKT